TKAAAARGIAGLEDRNVDDYIQLLPVTNGGLQEAVAQALRSALAARELALGQLSALAASLPEPARSTIARVIAAISAGSPGEIAGITSAMAVVPPQVRSILQQALDIAAQAVKLATDQLTAILPLLPEAARGPVQDALTRVTELLEMLRGLAGQLGNGTIPTGQLPALPGVPGVPGIPGAPALPGGLKFPFQLPFGLPFLG
nr:hypothetical protein [Thermoleophilaceae bacterium]